MRFIKRDNFLLKGKKKPGDFFLFPEDFVPL